MLRPEALDGVFWSCVFLFSLGSSPFPTKQVGWEECPRKSAGLAQGPPPTEKDQRDWFPNPICPPPPAPRAAFSLTCTFDSPLV